VFVFSRQETSDDARVLVEIEIGGWGGRPGRDGPNCLAAGVHNNANNPVELLEHEFPAVRLVEYGLRVDSGGPGQYRGGLGLVRTFDILDDCEFSSQFDRVKFPPPGILGGRAGAAGRITLDRDGSSSHLPGKVIALQLRTGDRITIETQGGGGLGDPRLRKREDLERDVLEEKVSHDAVALQYGMVADATVG
jgi:N-methylhydantoinase B/oxoprolinase/acetone carboxylase alpha subunit